MTPILVKILKTEVRIKFVRITLLTENVVKPETSYISLFIPLGATLALPLDKMTVEFIIQTQNI